MFRNKEIAQTSGSAGEHVKTCRELNIAAKVKRQDPGYVDMAPSDSRGTTSGWEWKHADQPFANSLRGPAKV
ncbi:hypothetical protein PG984_015351 [Apiospora sp. TS-2023a]